MAYKVIILYRLYMPSYFLGTFTEYPYVARHTWASTMRDLGVDLSIISTGLGHDSLRTTQIYLSTIDNASVTKANQMMINKLLAD